jgi:aminoglycoside/choline kinase family phosphotransferase
METAVMETARGATPGAPAGLVERFLGEAGWGAAVRLPLAGDASARRYERLELEGRRAVLMDATRLPESTRRFVAIAALLRRHRLSAPQIYAAHPAAGLLLIEDFGDDGVGRRLARGDDERRLYELAVDVLVALRRRVTPDDLAAVPAHDEAAILDGLSRLLDWYWPARLGSPAPEEARAAFFAAWRAVLPLRHGAPEGLALFDYHVDNLMLLDGRSGVAACGLLDFQDAARAPVTLDLACLLEDRRDLDPGLAAAMRARYLAAFPDLDADGFARSWAVVAAERHARILGTFTRLALRDGKADYLAQLPRVWRRLERALGHPALAPVGGWFDRHFPRALRQAPLEPARSA